jgi:hypothetical protein
MGKLTIEHLAPYLPYKLMIYCDFRDGDIMHFEMEHLSIEEAYLDGCDWDYQYNNDFKPILRPLSDLYNLLYKEFDNTNHKDYEIFQEFFNDDYLWISDLLDDNVDLKYIPFGGIEYLLKNHYDIYGLIENNLAIDINTLK